MHTEIVEWYEEHATEIIELANNIWSHPELSMQEFYACEETANLLERWGFVVERIALDKSEKPNTVVARFGEGEPVIGILGEYDALDGLGQEAVPYCKPIEGPGHGCGHNLMAAGCAGAAGALKAVMEKDGLTGTVIYYGCPGEEILRGKIVMDQDGYFDELDVCLNWHPGPKPNGISEDIMMACGKWVFAFKGKTAHAAGQPWEGRSALDAAELMNIGVQFLREHVTDDVRIHYAYIPNNIPSNVVPDIASVDYCIRANKYETYKEVADRVVKVAEGAATMTETDVTITNLSSSCESRVNHTLNRALYEAVKKVPKIEYTQEEKDFALELYKNVMGHEPYDVDILPTEMPEPKGIAVPFPGSSDLSPISQHVPLSWFFCLGDVVGTLGHHWGQVACSGMSIGHKGALYAGKCLAQCGYDLMKDPSVVVKAKKEMGLTY